MFLANEALTAALLGMVIGVPVLLVVFRTPPLRRWREERQFRSAMKRLGARVMRNVRLPDGMGGETVIDYLLLTTEAIRVVGVLRFPGLIFGGKRIDQWTQLINKRSYKFPNPDHYLQQQISAVRLIIPVAKVTGLDSGPSPGICAGPGVCLWMPRRSWPMLPATNRRRLSGLT